MEMKEEILAIKLNVKNVEILQSQEVQMIIKGVLVEPLQLMGGTEYLKRIGNENDYIELSISKDNNRQLFTQIIKK